MEDNKFDVSKMEEIERTIRYYDEYIARISQVQLEIAALRRTMQARTSARKATEQSKHKRHKFL